MSATIFIATNGTPIRAAMSLTPEQSEMTVAEYTRAVCTFCGVRGVELHPTANGRSACSLCDGVTGEVMP